MSDIIYQFTSELGKQNGYVIDTTSQKILLSSRLALFLQDIQNLNGKSVKDDTSDFQNVVNNFNDVIDFLNFIQNNNTIVTILNLKDIYYKGIIWGTQIATYLMDIKNVYNEYKREYEQYQTESGEGLLDTNAIEEQIEKVRRQKIQYPSNEDVNILVKALQLLKQNSSTPSPRSAIPSVIPEGRRGILRPQKGLNKGGKTRKNKKQSK
jgi:hypothetical protein